MLKSVDHDVGVVFDTFAKLQKVHSHLIASQDLENLHKALHSFDTDKQKEILNALLVQLNHH